MPDAQRTGTDVTQGWSVQTEVAHVGAWFEEAARVLEDIAAGTWDAATDPAERPTATRTGSTPRTRRGPRR